MFFLVYVVWQEDMAYTLGCCMAYIYGVAELWKLLGF